MFRRTVSIMLLPTALLGIFIGLAAAPSARAEEPQDASSLVIAVAKFWNGPEAEKLKKISQGHPIVLTHEALKLDDTIGVPIENIERVAMVSAGGGSVFIVRTVKPLDQDKIAKKLVPNPTENKTDQGNRYIGNLRESVVFLSDGRTFLVAPFTTVDQLAQKKPVAWSEEKLSVLGDPAKSKTLAAIQASPLLIKDILKADDPRFDPYRPLGDARSAQVTMAVDQGLQVTLRFGFSDQAAAQRALPALKKVLEGLNGYCDFAKGKLPEFFQAQQAQYPGAADVGQAMTAAIGALQAGLAKANVAQSGQELAATIAIKTDQPVLTAILLLSLSPRARKP